MIEGYWIGRDLMKTCWREGILRLIEKEEGNRREEEVTWVVEKVEGREEEDI